MKKALFYFGMSFIFFCFIFYNSTADSGQNNKEHIGTWKGTAYLYGTSTVFHDITVIVNDSNFEIDIFKNPGGTTLLAGSINGTHGILSPNTVCPFASVQVYSGTSWVPTSGTTNVQYSISGTAMAFLYDLGNPRTKWSLQGTLLKQ